MPEEQRKQLEEREIRLIEAFTKGDMAGFKHVYTLFRQKVLSYCIYYMGDRALAEDAFQEVFIRIYTRREQLREVRALKSWVLLITRSVCLNLLRSSKFTPEFVPLDNGDEMECVGATLNTPTEPLDYAIADDMLRVALAKLAPIYREAFLLFEFEGYDYPKIAQITNTTDANVKVRITRAKKQLRSLLAPHYQYEAGQQGSNRQSRKDKKEKNYTTILRPVLARSDDASFGPLDDTLPNGEVFA